MMELVARTDPSADLRPPADRAAPHRAPASRSRPCSAPSRESQVGRAITAIVAAGLSERARHRAVTPLPDATGVKAGLRLLLAPTNSGSLRIQGSALLTLFSLRRIVGHRHRPPPARATARRRPDGWLSATPDLELRSVSRRHLAAARRHVLRARATVTLHDARVFGQSWERLVLGIGPGAVPLLPEARVLLAAALQRISADAAGIASLALDELLTALGIVDAAGGVAGDALDQLLHDAGGLLRQRMATAGTRRGRGGRGAARPAGRERRPRPRARSASQRRRQRQRTLRLACRHHGVADRLGGELRFGAGRRTARRQSQPGAGAEPAPRRRCSGTRPGGAIDTVRCGPIPDAGSHRPRHRAQPHPASAGTRPSN